MEFLQKLLLAVIGSFILLVSWYLFANYLIYPLVKDSYRVKLAGPPPADMPIVVVVPDEVPPAVRSYVIKHGDIAIFGKHFPTYSFHIPKGWEKISTGKSNTSYGAYADKLTVPEALPGPWTVITLQQNFEEQLIRLTKQDEKIGEITTYEYVVRQDSLSPRSMERIPQGECFSKTSLLALIPALLLAVILMVPAIMIMLIKSKAR